MAAVEAYELPLLTVLTNYANEAMGVVEVTRQQQADETRGCDGTVDVVCDNLVLAFWRRELVGSDGRRLNLSHYTALVPA